MKLLILLISLSILKSDFLKSKIPLRDYNQIETIDYLPINNEELHKALLVDILNLLGNDGFFKRKYNEPPEKLIAEFSLKIQHLNKFEALYGKNAYIEAETIMKYLLKKTSSQDLLEITDFPYDKYIY